MRSLCTVTLALLLVPAAGWCQPAKPAMAEEIAAWKAYCARLEQVGTELLQRYPQPHAIDRQDALRYLASQSAESVRRVLIAEQPELPLLRVGATSIDKWGLDGADAKYLGAHVEGEGSYRLHGRLWSAIRRALPRRPCRR